MLSRRKRVRPNSECLPSASPLGTFLRVMPRTSPSPGHLRRQHRSRRLRCAGEPLPGWASRSRHPRRHPTPLRVSAPRFKIGSTTAHFALIEDSGADVFLHWFSALCVFNDTSPGGFLSTCFSSSDGGKNPRRVPVFVFWQNLP